MNTIERAAKTFAEWQLGIPGDQFDRLRYGAALPERRSLIDKLFPAR